jgi:hypothetical protein
MGGRAVSDGAPIDEYEIRPDTASPEAVAAAAGRLRARTIALAGTDPARHRARVIAAFARFARLWEDRLTRGWLPPTGAASAFPWVQTRRSLAALLPGFASADDWLQRGLDALPEGREAAFGRLVALILAGNTPLLAWPALAAVLLAGHGVFVKCSSGGESVWPGLFAAALADVDPVLADLVVIGQWPGQDPRTHALLGVMDAVIAYGGDSTIDALRAAAPDGTPFLGFGHAISVAIADADCPAEDSGGLAVDILMYDQQGCLSPHIVFVRGHGDAVARFGPSLAASLARAADALQVAPVTDPAIARAVRQARDLALFEAETDVLGDAGLRWTVAAMRRQPDSPLAAPVGHGFVLLLPMPDNAEEIVRMLGPSLCGRVSCVGVASAERLSGETLTAFPGISRIARAGEMQTPPLDWPNGRRDLLAELLRPRPTEAALPFTRWVSDTSR